MSYTLRKGDTSDVMFALIDQRINRTRIYTGRQGSQVALAYGGQMYSCIFNNKCVYAQKVSLWQFEEYIKSEMQM